MSRKDVRLAGFGGQGIILAGHILGKAASIYEDQHATLTQSYGPESRGGACSAQIVLSDEPVLYPSLLGTDILVLMSQEACARFLPDLQEGILLYDEDLVDPGKIRKKVTAYAIPATRMAEELGRTLVANIVMLGFLTATTKIVSMEAMRQAVLSTVPKGTEELNSKALEAGYTYGLKLLGEEPTSSAAAPATSEKAGSAASREGR
jgi:2-oxoglutarate ferredoxin oxidoreductase subunit gamma